MQRERERERENLWGAVNLRQRGNARHQARAEVSLGFYRRFYSARVNGFFKKKKLIIWCMGFKPSGNNE